MTTKEVEVFAVKGAVDWKSLTDVQWMNIVNHDHAFENHDKESAVHLAVKMTEAKLKELNYAALCAKPSRGEVVAWMVEFDDPSQNLYTVDPRDVEHWNTQLVEPFDVTPLCRCDAPAHPRNKTLPYTEDENGIRRTILPEPCVTPLYGRNVANPVAVEPPDAEAR
jgi:hypothetical protein